MNDFNNDLKYSHESEDNPIWRIIYNKAFPDNKSITNNREDSQTQRLGIDRTIILSSGKAIYIDEKVRRKDYGDILLEYISNDKYKTLGWVEKKLFCDYIAYAILDIKICYLLPVPQLQKAWMDNKETWLKIYGSKVAPNKSYNTLNCAIPKEILYKEIGKTLRINF
jgi:hypothetical protein